MASEAIFFPYIDVPNSAWSTRVLLYWDRAAAIIPESVLEEPGVLQPHTVELIDQDLLHPLRADYHAVSRPGFAESFLTIIDSDEVIRERGENGPGTYAVTRMHIGKLGLPVIEQLRMRGLAADGEWSDEYWVSVEKRTASRFMAYFALFLRNERARDFDPVTDDLDTLRALHAAPASEARAGLTGPDVRVALLRAALPLPAIQPSPRQLAQFKATHGPELVQFRRRIEQAVVAVTRLGSAAEQLELLREEQWTLEQELIAARERIATMDKGVLLGGLALLVGLVSNVVGEFPDPEALGLVAAGAGGIASTYLDLDVLPGFKPRSPDDPLAYAVLASNRVGSSGEP